MAFNHNLQGLSTREAITDALYRGVRGWDRNDFAALSSAYYGEDVSFEMVAGGEVTKIEGLSKIRDTVFAKVGPMDTTHMISDIRIDVKDGADTAELKCYALAQHCPPGRGLELDGPKFLAAGEYTLDLIKDQKDGLWKIKTWVLELIWRTGDASIMA